MDDDLPDFIKKKIIESDKDYFKKLDNDDMNIMFGIAFGIVITILFVVIIKIG